MPEGSERILEPGEPDGFIVFRLTGQPAEGEFRCSQCGYGVVVQVQLPRCPMCSGTAWEETSWGAIRRRPVDRRR
jgi:rubrerythrin